MKPTAFGLRHHSQIRVAMLFSIMCSSQLWKPAMIHAQNFPRATEAFNQWLQGQTFVSTRIQISRAARYEERRDTSSTFRNGWRLAWLSVPLQHARIIVEPVVKEDSIRKFFEHATRLGDVAVLNGGFFGRNGAPVGLVIASGVQRSARDRNRTEGGVIIQEKGKVLIRRISGVTSLSQIEQALQAWPILVWDSKVDNINPNAECSPARRAGCPANRVAVAIRGDELLFVIALGSYTPYEFARWLSEPSAKGGLAVNQALGLDGGPSAHLYLPRPGIHLGNTTNDYIPNVLHLQLAR